MALFKQDATINGLRVDELTEIYQLDDKNFPELLAFAKQKNITAIIPGSHYTSWLELEPTLPAENTFYQPGEIVMQMHMLTKSLMDSLYYKRVVKIADIGWVNWFYTSFVGPLLFHPYQNNTERKLLSDDEIPLSQFYRSTPLANQFQERFAKEIYNLVLDHQSESPKFPLRLCPGCESVFRTSRSDQQYCSDRCGNRVRVRRNLKKKKDAANDYLVSQSISK